MQIRSLATTVKLSTCVSSQQQSTFMSIQLTAQVPPPRQPLVSTGPTHGYMQQTITQLQDPPIRAPGNHKTTSPPAGSAIVEVTNALDTGFTKATRRRVDPKPKLLPWKFSAAKEKVIV